MIKNITKYVFILSFIYSNILNSQNVWINNGATVMNTPGVTVYVNGGLINQNSGTFDNSGEMHIFGDWTNNAGNTAFISSSPGKVILEGANQQITGTDITNFFRLELAGTGVKSLIDIYTIIEDSLILNDREFNLDTNTAFVINPSPGIIKRTTGFCSSLQNGGLARNTQSTSTYLFPMGSSIGTLRYRPIDITPNTATANTFKVRMANVDASTEGFNINTKDTSQLCIVNNLYYHKIWQLNGTSTADITFYFDTLNDGYFNTSAHWQTVPQWEDMLLTTNNYLASPNFSTITKSTWSSFSPYFAYALALTTPTVTLTTNPTPPVLCAYDTLQVTATSGFANYDFYVNGSIIQSGTDSIFNATGLNTNDSIYVIASDWRACNTISNIINNITVNPQPNVTISSLPNDTICSGNQVTLSGNGAVNYNWDNGVTDGVPFIINTTNTYTVIGTDNNGCMDTSQITITVFPSPTLSISAMPNDTLCFGDTLTLSGSGAVSYSWDNGVTDGIPFMATTTTTYTMTGTTASGCTATLPIQIVVNPLPVVTISANPADSVCLGDSTQLSATGNALTYLWDNGITSTNFYVTPTNDSTIILLGIDANGCMSADTTTVKVLPVPTITILSDTAICYNESVQLQAIGNNINTIIWTNGSTLDDSTSISPIASPLTTTTYIATAGIGMCTKSDTVTVTVYNLPLINAGNDTTILFGQSVLLNASSTGNNYTWLPSDFLSCSDCPNPTASPEETTEYIVIVSDSNGCINTDTLLIVVDLECADIFIPNIFTPNGDGDNDNIEVYNYRCVQTMEFLIFDRWGNNVYSSTDPTQKWNGYYKGERAETGVYVYILKATLTNGKEITKKGNITLLK